MRLSPVLPPDSGSPTQGFQTPVLLLIFNRPETTRQVFESIRQARPARLYVAADGPRPGHPTDAVRCAEARAIVDEIDWPCELHTLFQKTNLNCGVAPATAISWFFDHEPEGIILEDDCCPSPSFFRFCEEVLTRYRDDERVMHVGGNNFAPEAQQPLPAGADSYYFSHQVNSWGWATWRRAWQHFDFHLTHLPELKHNGQLQRHYSSWLEEQYWLRKFEGVYHAPQSPDIWDYQWHFAVMAHSGLAIVPSVNLVSNIGFGQQGTHTHDAADQLADVPAQELTFPLRHPAFVLPNLRRDQQHFRRFLLERVFTKLRRFLPQTKQPAAPVASATAPAPAPLQAVSA